jgi:hypothetical protein
MMPVSNEDLLTTSPNPGHRLRTLDNALELGPRKKAQDIHNAFRGTTADDLLSSCFIDPLVHHGRHFGQTIHALCRVQALLTNGIIREMEMDAAGEEALSAECIQSNTANNPYLLNSISFC